MFIPSSWFIYLPPPQQCFPFGSHKFASFFFFLIRVHVWMISYDVFLSLSNDWWFYKPCTSGAQDSLLHTINRYQIHILSIFLHRLSDRMKKIQECMTVRNMEFTEMCLERQIFLQGNQLIWLGTAALHDIQRYVKLDNFYSGLEKNAFIYPTNTWLCFKN